MNALDKLRKLKRDIEPDSDPILWDILRAGVEQSWDCEEDDGKTLTGALSGIADQIEREQGVDAGPYDYRLVRMTWAVRWVMRDMERHLLGHEGMEDSPVARWARELRNAMETTMSRHESDAVAGSPYDSLTGEEREAAAWVREHGGLSHVKDIYHDLRAVVERLGVEWSESELHGLMDALDRRLMPEGVEWPRYEDGEPVRFEDELPDFAGTIYKTVKSVRFNNYGYVVIDNAGGSANVSVIIKSGQRVKRPNTKPEQPDSWERIEEDAKKDRCSYFGANYQDCGRCTQLATSCSISKARDLVRRCRALAERERGE